MTMVQPEGPYSWLEVRAVRNASDVVLGGLLLAVAAAAILDPRRPPLGTWGLPEPGLFPTLVGGLMAAIGVLLLARGALGRAPRHMKWQVWQILPVVALVAVVLGVRLYSLYIDFMYVPAQQRPVAGVLLVYGPAEYVATILLGLSVAIALSRLSRLRAAGMVLLGLLLAVVGEDVVSSGAPRLTMGVEQLAEGVDPFVLAAGLIWVADSMVCLFSPALSLATYTRRISGWRDPVVSTNVAIGMRIAAALVIVGSCYLLYLFFERLMDVALVLFFAALGVACKLLGWNRSLLLLGFACSFLLELHFLQSLVISRGDLTYFFSGPLRATLLIAAGVILMAALALSLRRALTRNAAAAPA